MSEWFDMAKESAEAPTPGEERTESRGGRDLRIGVPLMAGAPAAHSSFIILILMHPPVRSWPLDLPAGEANIVAAKPKTVIRKYSTAAQILKTNTSFELRA